MAQTESIGNAQITSINHYDDTPYTSHPFSLTAPSHLKAIAHIFGLETSPIETARILELGCASGGNIMPHAIRYPNAKFIGVDFSKVQTDIARKQVEKLGLKNIEFKTISITDIDKSLGEFDYIICHGVISWVPENVREAILRVCNENLSSNGVAYVSYNTLPGWNMIRSIRDMMLFHSRNFKEVSEQVQQSRLLLNFIKDALVESKSPYSEILSAEAKMLEMTQNDYLRHDHMEEINHQYYFHEFIKEANKHGLQYLGDSQLVTMYSGRFPQKVAEKLKEIQDIIRSEQYMDFLTNRRFRSTILCKNNIPLNRNITSDSLDKIYFRMNILPAKLLQDITLDNGDSLEFYYNNDKENKLSTTSPILKAMFYVFHDNINFALNIEDIISKIQALLPKYQDNKDAVKNELMTNITSLVFQGYIIPSTEKPQFLQVPSDTPKVSNMISMQLEEKQNWVTNELHDKLAVNPFDFCLLKYLNGKNNKEHILEKVVEHFINGDLTITHEGKSVTDPSTIKQLIKPHLDNCLINYAKNALLVA